MADKVKLTPPMTDSKTPDWVKEEAMKVLDTYLREPISPDQAISQALLSAYERGRKEGIEEAAKVALTRSPDDDNLDWQVRQQVATAIRQLLEVKG
jgi:hypothetical protein